MRLSRGRLIVAGLIATLLGFVFLRGPTPDIAIKAETLQSVGPINVTNTMMTSWIVVIIIIAVVYLGTRRRDLVPSRSFIDQLSTTPGCSSSISEKESTAEPSPSQASSRPRSTSALVTVAVTPAPPSDGASAPADGCAWSRR